MAEPKVCYLIIIKTIVCGYGVGCRDSPLPRSAGGSLDCKRKFGFELMEFKSDQDTQKHAVRTSYVN